MIVILIAIILIVIVGFTNRDRMNLTTMERITGNIFAPIQKVFFSIGNKVSNGVNSILNIGSLKSENEELAEEVKILEEKVRNYENIIGKSSYLKDEYELLANSKYKLIPSQVTSKEPGNWFNRFVIDKGLKHGVKKGDTIVQGVEYDGNFVTEGIIGRVIDVGDNWSKVSSIIDESSSISFKLIRTQDGGILSGNSEDGNLIGYLFDPDADIMEGDKVITSGIGGIFVKDMYIGEITKIINNEDELVKQVVVEPALDFRKIYSVLILSQDEVGE